MALQIPILTSFTFIKDQIFNRKQIIHAPSSVMPWLTFELSCPLRRAL
jgi:hypothetical protein